MAQFDPAVSFVLRNEGGLAEDSADPGGITNFGISLRFVREIPPERLKRYGIFEPITEQTIRELTVDQAKLIYRGEFWDAAPFDKLMNQILCNYIFDMCVNHGIAQGIKLAQRAVWACQKNYEFIKDDGVLGKFTIQAINHCSFMLQVAMMAQRDGFYRRLVALNPSRKADLHGWLKRCYQV
jgi:lysozyme family protein